MKSLFYKTKSIDTIMLFAAGRGTRMGNLTNNTPKTLLTVLGKPILHYSLDFCRTYPFKKIIINTHYLSKKIEQTVEEFQKKNPEFPEIVIIYEKDLLETGGAIKNAIGLIGPNPIFTLNTDVILKSDDNIFEAMLNFWNSDKMDFLLLMQPFNKSIGYRGRGDFEINEKGLLSRPNKKDNYSYMYAGLQILKPLKIASNPLKIFSLKEYYHDNNKIYGLPAKNTKWYHATTPEDIYNIEDNLKKL